MIYFLSLFLKTIDNCSFSYDFPSLLMLIVQDIHFPVTHDFNCISKFLYFIQIKIIPSLYDSLFYSLVQFKACFPNILGIPHYLFYWLLVSFCFSPGKYAVGFSPLKCVDSCFIAQDMFIFVCFAHALK